MKLNLVIAKLLYPNKLQRLRIKINSSKKGEATANNSWFNI